MYMRLIFTMLFAVSFVVVLFYTKQSKREITLPSPKKIDAQFVVLEYSHEGKNSSEDTFREIQDKGIRTVFIQGDVKENDLNQFAHFENVYDFSIVPVSRKSTSSQKIKFAGVPVFKGGTFLAETADDMGMQKNEYKICSIEQNSRIKCKKYSFSDSPIASSDINVYDQFLQELRELIDKEHVQKQMSLEEAKLDGRQYATTYLTLKKAVSGCTFPSYEIKVEGGGLYKDYKVFKPIRTSDDTLFIFLSGNPDNGTYIDKVWFYYPSVDPQYCKDFTISFYTFDFNDELAKFRSDLPTYSLSLENKEYKKLLDAIPSSPEARFASDFNFPYVDSLLTFKNKNYITRLKNRGLTLVHWNSDKKSYTLKFIDIFANNEKLLFIIPEKRAYTEEYVINNLSKVLHLTSLQSQFGKHEINGKNYGIYYISEDFDKYFLAKRYLTEANIYTGEPNTDPNQIDKTYDVNEIQKHIFSSSINAYKQDFDRDIDYFLQTIKLDNETLSRQWKYRFDPENLKAILALFNFTGTAHYNVHNVVFYINPANGRIYFFPWDFMNYTHVGDLQREDINNSLNDFININSIFSKLLEIPEIRNLRNQTIYENADTLLSYLKKFKQGENIELMTNLLNDDTIKLYAGEWNRPPSTIVWEAPQIIENNIKFLKDKISFIKVRGSIVSFARKRYAVRLLSDSFSSLKLAHLTIENLRPEEIMQLKVNGSLIPKEEIQLTDRSDGQIEIRFKKDLFINPHIEYKKEYAAPIYVRPSQLNIEITLNGIKNIDKATVIVENVSTSEKKELSLIQEKLFDSAKKNQSVSSTKAISFNNTLLQKIARDNQYTFKSKNVVLMENFILPKGTTLIIKPGTSLFFAEGKSLISYGKIIAKGTKKQPIKFSILQGKKQWGVIGLVQEDAAGEFEYCTFEKGGDAYINGTYFSGMLSSYYADVSVNNCMFSFANRRSGDDGVNVKYGLAVIKNSSFLRNSADAIDLDYVKEGSRIENNVIENSGGDGVDISESKSVTIKKNTISSSGDKGVSVGEASVVFMIQNSISHSTFGVAAKDSSLVKVIQNDITNNKIGIAAYNKKENYGGAKIYVTNTLLKHNKQDFGLEIIGAKDSQIIVSHSTYRLTGAKTNEIIQMPNKISVSKKKVLELVLRNQLDVLRDNVVQFATLVDYAQKNYVEYD